MFTIYDAAYCSFHSFMAFFLYDDDSRLSLNKFFCKDNFTQHFITNTRKDFQYYNHNFGAEMKSSLLVLLLFFLGGCASQNSDTNRMIQSAGSGETVYGVLMDYGNMIGFVVQNNGCTKAEDFKLKTTKYDGKVLIKLKRIKQIFLNRQLPL